MSKIRLTVTNTPVLTDSCFIYKARATLTAEKMLLTNTDHVFFSVSIKKTFYLKDR
jgi:hypothetical protein